MPYMTTVTTPNFVPPAQEVIAQISSWCDRQQQLENYTGQSEFGMLPDGTTHVAKRWDWIDLERAEAYIAYMQSVWTPPAGTNIDISAV